MEIGEEDMSRRYRNKDYYEEDERLPVPEESVKVPDPVYGKIIGTSALIMRESPTIKSRAISVLKAGDTLEILDDCVLGFKVDGNTEYFKKVSFDGLTGYVVSIYCTKVGV